MKLLNKILLVFIAISMITLYGGWRFIHSEQFSKDISSRVSTILTKKFGARLSFTGVEFSLVPLSTTFKDVKILRKDPDVFDIELEAEALTAAFSYSSFISSDLEIEELHLQKGFTNLVIHKESREDFALETLNLTKVYSDYQEILSKIPVRLNLISLKDIKIQVDNSFLNVVSLSVSPHKRQLRARAQLENIKIDTELESKPLVELDKLETLLFFKKDEWKVENLSAIKGKNQLQVSGVFHNVKDKFHFDSKGTLQGRVEEFLGEIPGVPTSILPIMAGISGEFTTTGVVTDLDATAKFEALNVQTKWIKLQKVNGVIKKNKNFISAEKLEAINENEKYILRQKQSFYDLKWNKFTDFHFKLKLVNAHTNTFLYYLRDSLDVLKGSLTGDVEIKLDEQKATFLVLDKVALTHFKLDAKNAKKPIFQNAGFQINKSSFVVDKEYVLHIDSNLTMAQTFINAKGTLGNGKIDIKLNDSKIDLRALGPIAGINLTGNGPVQLAVSGPLDHVKFEFVVDWTNFSLIDLHFGQVKSKFTFYLNELQINIEELVGIYNQSNYSANGTLDFKDKKGMDLKVNFADANFTDVRKMLALIFNKIKMPVVPEFKLSSSVSIKGGYDVPSLNVEGVLKGSEIKIGNEEADRLTTRFTLINNHLNFRQLKINKARGQLMANVSVALENNFIELNGAAQGVRLNDFNSYKLLNLEYDGDLFLDFDGNGTPDDFNSRFKLRLANAFIGNIPASSSNALFYVNSEDVVTNASLLGGKIKLDSLLKINTGMTATKASIETNDIKEILGIYSGHNISEKGITGKIKADLNTQISVKGEGVRKFYLNISDLTLKKGNIDLRVDPKYNKIEVEDGIVKVWDLRFRDGEEFFTSKGRNVSNGVIALDQKFSIKANILELASEYVDRAVGSIKGFNSLVLEKQFTVKDFNINADNLSLKIKNLPGFFNNLQFNVVKKAEVYELIKLTGKYGEGDIRVSGRVVFDDRYPQVSLDYKIERATIPLFKKSNVLISSNGMLSGTDLPYKLNGRLFLLHGEFLDDPADFTKDGKINIDEYKKYLPQKDMSGKRAYLDANISFEIVNPLVVKNNMAEVYFRGNGQATGDVMSPELNTRLEVVPQLSKFKFKGHDFELSQGYVEIRDRGKNRLSDLKFTGVAKINDYDMKLDLSGNISKVNVDLSSEPALSKEDLLSLLTFGVTSDMSKNLEASERKFVTTVGIGTLLVDQLKINEDLNSSLGLKLSVQPEFKENESTLTQGKAAVSDTSTSRLKSATKIKINKQVTNKVDVSLSSTVGGSLEQKQEMNVNFNINKNMSVEGVYEVKPTESENTNTPNSLGADLKFRWSF